MNSFDMRLPSKPDFDDALRVTVRRQSLIERIQGAWWLLVGGDGASTSTNGERDNG